MADSHVDPKGHVNFNKNYITKKKVIIEILFIISEKGLVFKSKIILPVNF